MVSSSVPLICHCSVRAKSFSFLESITRDSCRVESMAGVEEEGEVAALREALRQQAVAVEELRKELEEERQAAASGADEALAMILRLQAEKAAERMEAEQFRRVAEERIQHDEDTLAFLKAVVFHQEMEISSLNRRLLAVQAAGGGGGEDPFSRAVDLPWLRKLAKNGVSSRRNASLPAASLEELCSELDADASKGYPCKNVGDRRPPARTVSDVGEVIMREKEWARPNQPAAPRLHRSASHRLRRAPSYSAHCGTRSARASPEIIAEEDDEKACKSNATLEADVEQIKATVQGLEAELTKLRESTLFIGDAQSRLLAEIHAKLDGAIMPRQQSVQGGHGSSSIVQVSASRGGSSMGGGGYKSHPQPQGELLMNHFIEVCVLAFSALLVRPLIRVVASMSLLRCLLILVLAVAIRKVVVNS